MKRKNEFMETDSLRLDDLSRLHNLPYQKNGNAYCFEEFMAHGLEQALGFVEGYDRAVMIEPTDEEPITDLNETLTEALIWAICPFVILREWPEALPKCGRCPAIMTMDEHQVVCPHRDDAEEAAKAVLSGLGQRKKGE